MTQFGPSGQSVAASAGRGPLFRWFASSATLVVPQAAGPVAFSLLALSLIGDERGGAAMILAMTLAQVAGAIPITRLGRKIPAATYVRMLVGLRTAALVGIVLCAWFETAFGWLIALSALAGSVNGAAFGYLRSMLNDFTDASRLPRALGISSTLNETAFVLAPVLASGLGSVSPVLALFVITALGAVPMLLVPKAGLMPTDDFVPGNAALLSAPIMLWLVCAAAGNAAIAAVEIGAVALALDFGYRPAMAILFTVPLGVASVIGGIWVSVRNRSASLTTVIAQLSVMVLGVGLAASRLSLETTVAGAILIGLVLAPLAMHYALILDRLAPPQRRAEVFALLRTSSAVGVIFTSAVLTTTSISRAFLVVTCVMIAVTVTVAFSPASRKQGAMEAGG